MNRKHAFVIIFFLAIVAVIWQLLLHTSIEELLEGQSLIVMIGAIVVLKAATVIIAPLSGGALYVLVGVVFPFWWSVVWLSVGNALGVSGAYWLGKTYGWRVINYVGGEQWIKQGEHLLSRMHDRKSFLFVRTGLFFAEDIVNYLGGMAKVGFLPFFVISMVLTTIFMLLILRGADSLVFLLTLL